MAFLPWLQEKGQEVVDFATDEEVLKAVAIAYVTGGMFGGEEMLVWDAGAAASAATLSASSIAVTRATTPSLPDMRGQGIGDLSDRGSRFQFTAPAASREIVYGKVRKSGVITNIETTDATFVAGSGTQYLWITIAVCAGGAEEIHDIYLNDVSIGGKSTNSSAFEGPISSSNYYYGYAEYFCGLGGSTSNLSSMFKTSHPFAAGAGPYDTHYYSRLENTCYVTVRLKYDATIFEQGVPKISFLVQGKRVLDTRYSSYTTGWQNPAMCIRDYLIDPIYGLGIPEDQIDTASFNTAASKCDETPTGRTTKRFKCNGVIDTQKSVKANIEDMLTSCAGVLNYSNGKFKLKVGTYSTPTVTLTKDDFIGDITVSTKNSIRDQFNTVKAIYFDETQNQIQDAEVIKLDVYAADGGEKSSIDLSLPFTTSLEEAKHLSYLAINQSRHQIRMTVRCKMTAFRFDIGDTVYITDDSFGWNQKVFEVLNWGLVSDGLSMAVDLTLKETSSEAYDYGIYAPNVSTVYKFAGTTVAQRFGSGYNDLSSLFSDWGSETTKELYIDEYYDVTGLQISTPALPIPSGLKGKLIIRNFGDIVGVRHNYLDSATLRAGDAIVVESQAYDPEILIINEGRILGAGGKGGNGGDGGYAIDDESNTLNGGLGGDNDSGFYKDGQGAGYQSVSGGNLPTLRETGDTGAPGGTGQSDPAASAYAGNGGTAGAGGGFGEDGEAGNDGADGSSPYGFGTGASGSAGGLAGRAIVDNSGVSGGINMTVVNRGTISGDVGSIIIS